MKLATMVFVIALIIFMSSATTDWVVVAAGRVPVVPKPYFHEVAASQVPVVPKPFFHAVAASRARPYLHAAAVTCDPLQLGPCLEPIQTGSRPSSTCCNKLKEQVPCLCGYIKNPAFKKFLSGPNAQKLSANCGVPSPHCS